MPAPLLVLFGPDPQANALAALGLAMGFAREGRHVVLVDADLQSAALTRSLGLGHTAEDQAPPNFTGLLRGDKVQPIALSAEQGFSPRAGLWWLPACAFGQPLDPELRRVREPAEVQALALALSGLSASGQAPDLVLVNAPADLTPLGLALASSAQALALFGEEDSLQGLRVFLHAVVAARAPAPLRYELPLLRAQVAGENEVVLDMGGVQRGQAPELSRVESDSAWAQLVRPIGEDLGLPSLDACTLFRRMAAVGNVEGCDRAFGVAWAEDSGRALEVFDALCIPSGGPLQAAVGAIRALRRRLGHEVPDHVLKVAAQRLQLERPSPLANEVLQALLLKVRAGSPDDDPTTGVDLLIACAGAAIHHVNYLRQRRLSQKATLDTAVRLLRRAASRTMGPVHQLRIATTYGDLALVSAALDTLPLARAALASAADALPTETARWGTQVIGRYAVASRHPELLAELRDWAERLIALDPGPGHYWMAVAFAQMGRRDQAWSHLRECALHAPRALHMAAQDPDLEPLRDDFGSSTYFLGPLDPFPPEEYPYK